MVTASCLWKFHYSSDEAAGRDPHCVAAQPTCMRWFQGMWGFSRPLQEFFWPQPGPTVLCPASIASPDLHALFHILSRFGEEALASFERWEHRSCIIRTRHWEMSHGVGNGVQGNPQVWPKSLNPSSSLSFWSVLRNETSANSVGKGINHWLHWSL